MLQVLVVDDDVDAAEMLLALLAHEGHRVHVAHDGKTAVGMARADAPDVVLLDIELPEKHGFDVATELGTLDPRPVLVAVTGYGLDEDRARTREAGFDSHLAKPIDFNVLRKMLRRVEQDREGAPARS